MDTKNKIKILTKLFEEGYDTDKKIQELNLEKIILSSSFSKIDLIIVTEIKKALINKNLISYLSGNYGGDKM